MQLKRNQLQSEGLIHSYLPCRAQPEDDLDLDLDPATPRQVTPIPSPQPADPEAKSLSHEFSDPDVIETTPKNLMKKELVWRLQGPLLSSSSSLTDTLHSLTDSLLPQSSLTDTLLSLSSLTVTLFSLSSLAVTLLSFSSLATPLAGLSYRQLG